MLQREILVRCRLKGGDLRSPARNPRKASLEGWRFALLVAGIQFRDKYMGDLFAVL